MLKTHFLKKLQSQYHEKKYLSSDPLEFVHRFSDPWDQEAVALVSALLAYGNVKQIRNSIETVLFRVSQHYSNPKNFVKSLQKTSGKKKAEVMFEGFVHRFNTGKDLVLLFKLLEMSWTKYGSLGAHFLSKVEPRDTTIENSLSLLIADWKSWVGKSGNGMQTSFSYLLTSPQDGSCCKRWCMLLRWMIRKDELDLGLWTENSPLRSTFPKEHYVRTDQLVIPLDTHTGRISQHFGLTKRKTLNWQAALEVTEALKEFNAKDPVSYDFALSRLGIIEGKFS